MKRVLLIAGLGAGLSAATFAQSLGPKARIFAKYDTNKNGVIDGEEMAAVRKALAADPQGEFATYDKDRDGKLSDGEIAGIKPPGAKRGGEKKKSAAEKPAETDGKSGDNSPAKSHHQTNP